jgi:excisionase family DNA binding protein
MTDTFHPACLLNHTLAHAPTVATVPAGAVERTGEPSEPAAPPIVFHTVEEVALTLDVSSKTIARRIREGVIRKVPLGGRLVRISSAELQRLAAAAPLRPAR